MNSTISTLVFLVRDDQILLALKKRGFGAGLWNGAGGKVESQEIIEQAMIRECQEEIGVTPIQYRKVAVHQFDYEKDVQTIEVHTYLCDNWLGEPMETEEMNPQWFALSEIPYTKMWEDDIHWLPKVLAGQKLHTKFTFNSDNTLLNGKLHEAENLDGHG